MSILPSSLPSVQALQRHTAPHPWSWLKPQWTAWHAGGQTWGHLPYSPQPSPARPNETKMEARNNKLNSDKVQMRVLAEWILVGKMRGMKTENYSRVVWGLRGNRDEMSCLCVMALLAFVASLRPSKPVRLSHTPYRSCSPPASWQYQCEWSKSQVR